MFGLFGKNTNQKDNTGDTAAQVKGLRTVPVKPRDNPNVVSDIPGDNDIIENLNILFDGINKSNNKSKGHIKIIEGNLKRIQEALENPELQNQVSKLEKEIQTINKEKNVLNTTITELKAAQKNLNADLISKEQINSEAITNKNRVNESNKELSKQNKVLNTNIEALQKELTEKDTDINKKLTQINELVKDNMGLKEDSVDVAKQLEELEGLYSELLKSNQQPVEESEEDTGKEYRRDPPVESRPGDGDGFRQKPEPEPEPEPAKGDGSSQKPKQVMVNKWVGPGGGRKTRHRGKSRKNKKTRKNKKQKKTTKK